MPEHQPKYVSFVSFRTDKDSGAVKGYILTADREEITRWNAAGKAAASTNGQTSSRTNEPEKVDESGKVTKEHLPHEALAELLERFRDSIMGVQHLIQLGSYMMPLLKQRALKEEVYGWGKREFDCLDDEEGYQVFGITAEQHNGFMRRLDKFREIEKSSAALPQAILLNLVASFDSFVADILRIMLRSRPDRYNNSQKTITIKDLLSMNSFEDAINGIVESEVDNLMRGTHSEQIKFIDDNLSTKIKENYDKWPKFIEVFERRNLVAHGACVVNK
jgi:hypothetical protein